MVLKKLSSTGFFKTILHILILVGIWFNVMAHHSDEHKRKCSHSAKVKEYERILAKNLAEIKQQPEPIIDELGKAKTIFGFNEIKEKLTESLRRKLKAKSNIESIEQFEAALFEAQNVILRNENLLIITKKDFNGRFLYASKNRYKLEQEFVNACEKLSKRHGHAITINYEIDKNLTVKQQEVVKGILEGSDLVIVQGLPGAGKSTIMKAVAQEYKSRGYMVLGCAVSAAACNNLKSIVEDIEIKTIAGWRKHFEWLNENGSELDLGPQDVLIVDEMSMVELEDLNYLLNIAAVYQSKIIMAGDVNQFNAIYGKGAAKKALSRGNLFVLDEVIRAKTNTYKQAVEHMARKDIAAAFESLNSAQVFDFSTRQEIARNRLVVDYINKYIEIVQQSGKKYLSLDKKIVILANTNEEVRQINALVREKLKDARVVFGTEAVLKLNGRKIGLCQGDQIVFGKNDRDLGVINGSLGVVKEIQQLGKSKAILKVELKDGKVIDFNTASHKWVDYGYALTGFKAQGSTYSDVFVMYEKSFNYESFNVMTSRHTDSLKIYLDHETLTDEDNITARWKNSILQKLIDKFEINACQGFSLDYDYKSEQAITIKEYLVLRDEVKKHIDTIDAWRDEYYSKYGYKPSLSKYKEITEFVHLCEEKKAFATRILDDYGAYEAMLATVRLSKKTLIEDESKIEDGYKLIGKLKNPEFSFEELTRKWLKYQDTLKEHIAQAELRLNRLQQDYEANDLELKEYNSYLRLQELYLSQIYKEMPRIIRQRWQLLAKEKTSDNLAKEVQSNPEILGDLLGKKGIFGESDEFKGARSLAHDVGISMIKAQKIQDNNLNEKQLKLNGMTDEINKIEEEIKQLEGKLGDKRDIVFMKMCCNKSNRMSETGVGRWYYLINKSRLISDAELNKVIDLSKEDKQSIAEEENVSDQYYRNLQEKSYMTLIKLARFCEQNPKSNILKYGALSLYVKQRAELQSLPKPKTAQKLAKNSLEKQAEIYSKIIQAQQIIKDYELQKQVRHQKLQELSNKIEGRFTQLARIYKEDPGIILERYVKLKAEQPDTVSVVNKDPKILGKMRGIGLGSIIMTKERLNAYQAAKGLSEQLKRLDELNKQQAELTKKALNITKTQADQAKKSIGSLWQEALNSTNLSQLLSTSQN